MSWRSSPAAPPRFLGLAVLALVAWALLAPPVSAHTTLLETEPADGTVLENPPHEIRLTFDGALVPDLLVASVVDGDGHEVAGTTVAVDQVVYVVITLPDLPEGGYRVSWRAVSALDRHVTTGTLVFDVGLVAGRVPPPPPDDLLPAGASAARAFELAGFALLAGALLVLARGAGRRDGFGPAARRRLQIIAVAGTALALLGGTARHLLDDAELAVLGGAAWGGAWLPEVAATLAIAAALLLARRAGRNRGQAVATILLLAAAATAIAVPGHLEGLGAAGRVVAALHLLGAAVWIGGVATLVLAVPVVRRESGGGAAVATVRRFALPALLAAGLVIASGIASLGGALPSISALAGEYGLVLAIKTGVAVAILGLGFRNASALHARAALVLDDVATSTQRLVGVPGRIPRPRLSRRWIGVEATAGLVVIVLAVTLASTTQAAPRPDLVPSIASGSGRADDLVVNLEVRPVRFGPNFAAVSVLDTRRPSPGVVTAIEVVAGSPFGEETTYDARELERGRWEVSQLRLDVAGPWRARVVIHRSGMPDTGLLVDLPVPEPPAMLAEQRPLAAPAGIIAIATIGVLLISGALVRRRRRRVDAIPGAFVAPATR